MFRASPPAMAPLTQPHITQPYPTFDNQVCEEAAPRIDNPQQPGIGMLFSPQGAAPQRSPLQPPDRVSPKPASMAFSQFHPQLIPAQTHELQPAQMFAPAREPTVWKTHGPPSPHKPQPGPGPSSRPAKTSARPKKRQRSPSPTETMKGLDMLARASEISPRHDEEANDSEELSPKEWIFKDALQDVKSGAAPANTQTSRSAASLVVLTKKFIELIEKTPNGELDLNQAAEQLCVQKRRVYDIVNVLEGVDVVSKTSKNRIQWKKRHSLTKGESSAEFDEQEQLNREIEALAKEEQELDSKLEDMEAALLKLMEEQKRHLHLAQSDINQLYDNQHTVISIKTPLDATCEILIPDGNTRPEHGKYQVFMQSPGGMMQVMLLRPTDGVNLVKTVH
eukprot:TRINITY_DN10883_c0_g2_i1.p1 TRINITY_DN10883_c0_g2~~TRINITY_DN10883_c0_g2_i1.p1  ORF type:complete len:393 (-),score=71.21 TRINITY_DN10883_c0_g2_i1:246-1424(-)